MSIKDKVQLIEPNALVTENSGFQGLVSAVVAMSERKGRFIVSIVDTWKDEYVKSLPYHAEIVDRDYTNLPLLEGIKLATDESYYSPRIHAQVASYDFIEANTDIFLMDAKQYPDEVVGFSPDAGETAPLEDWIIWGTRNYKRIGDKIKTNYIKKQCYHLLINNNKAANEC